MSTKHLNIYAHDRRFAGSLGGLGKSRLETLEHHFSSQIKIIGKGPITTRPRAFTTKQAKLSVHRVQGVIFFTGRGFQDLAKCSASCSSVGKATLHRGTYEPSRMLYGYGGKND